MTESSHNEDNYSITSNVCSLTIGTVFYVTATSHENPRKTAACTITVGVPVASACVDRLDMKLLAGESVVLSATIGPSSASNPAAT